MTNQNNITRINNQISKQITNLQANQLLNWTDKVCVSEIISHLANAVAALTYAGEQDGEEWKDD